MPGKISKSVDTNVKSDIQPIKDFVNLGFDAGCMVCIHTSAISTDSLVFDRSGSFIDVILPNGLSVLLTRTLITKITKVIYDKYIASGHNEDVIKQFFVKFMTCLFNVVQALNDNNFQAQPTQAERHLTSRRRYRRMLQQRYRSSDKCIQCLQTIITEEFESNSNEAKANTNPSEDAIANEFRWSCHNNWKRTLFYKYDRFPDPGQRPYRINRANTYEDAFDYDCPNKLGFDVAEHLIRFFDHIFAENFNKAGIPHSIAFFEAGWELGNIYGITDITNSLRLSPWPNMWERLDILELKHVAEQFSKTLDENVFVRVPQIGIVLLKKEENEASGLPAVENLRFYMQSMSYLDTAINYDYKFIKSYRLDGTNSVGDFKDLYYENNTDVRVDEKCTWAIKLGKAILSDQPVDNSLLYKFEFGTYESEQLTKILMSHCVDLQGIRPICRIISDFCSGGEVMKNVNSLMVDFVNLVKNYPIDSHEPEIYDSTNDDSSLWLPPEDVEESSSSEESDCE